MPFVFTAVDRSLTWPTGAPGHGRRLLQPLLVHDYPTLQELDPTGMNILFCVNRLYLTGSAVPLWQVRIVTLPGAPGNRG